MAGLACMEDSRKEKVPLEILYDGYFYDVTDYLSQHPGGKVMMFYTEKGEDATHAIQQFHHRSFKKIQLLLKSLKKRPATDSERKF
jgi:cytochrome b involved in lipid metabolism